MAGHLHAQLGEAGLLFFSALSKLGQLLLGVPLAFPGGIGSFKHASLGGFDAFVRLIPLGLKRYVTGCNRGLKLRGQPILRLSSQLLLVGHISPDGADCSPQRNLYIHGAKAPQIAHTNFGTGECSADKPLHRGMQRRETSARENPVAFF
jgi:hypothetical protein